MLNLDNVDRNKKCRYHKNTGHSTEECQVLKDKIEELIQAGHLRRFVQGGRTTRRSPCREEAPRKRDCTLSGPKDDDRHRERRERRDDPPMDDCRKGREVINTIADGFAGGGSSNSARKKHMRVVHQVNSVNISSFIVLFIYFNQVYYLLKLYIGYSIYGWTLDSF